MLCKQCGTEIPEDAVLCEACQAKETPETPVPVQTQQENPAKTPKKKKKGPGFFMGLLSFILCLALMVSLVASVAILDVRMLTSKDNMQKIVSSLLSAPPRPRLPMIQTGAVKAGGHQLRLDETDGAAGSQDAMQSALLDFVMEQVQGQFGEDLPIEKEAIEAFLEKSTATEFISDKMSGYMEDFINGTSNTTITTEDIQQLVEENKELIESEFGIQVTDEVMDTVMEFVEETKIDQIVHEEIIENVGKTNIGNFLPGLPNFNGPNSGDGDQITDEGAPTYTITDLLADLREATSVTMLAGAIGVCLLIMVLLFFTRGMRIDKCLRTSGVPTIIVGVILSIPVAAIQFAAPTLVSMIPDLALLMSVINAVIAVIAPVHYGVLVLGIAFVIIGSIIGSVMKKKAAKAAA